MVGGGADDDTELLSTDQVARAEEDLEFDHQDGIELEPFNLNQASPRLSSPAPGSQLS